MQKCIRFAKLCALSEKPVLIMGEAGTEKRLMAQSIHNAGIRGNGPFVDVSCDGIQDEAQLEMIFGDKGAVAQAAGGSILIEDICYLTRANQYRLYQLIRYKLRMSRDVVQYPNVDVRVMVTTKTPLAALMRRGILREDLYYLLEGLSVKIPPLRERPEDLEWKIDTCIKECCEHYSRYHVLTQGAKKKLMGYPWEGNLFQVENFCERLILSANKRSLDENVVGELLAKLYPAGGVYSIGDPDVHSAEGRNGSATDKTGNGTAATAERRLPEEALKIRETLDQMAGSREKTAKELGISKATLWRKMKKYGLE